MAVNGESVLIEQKISRLSIISDDGGMKIEAENELTVEDKHCAQKWGFRVKELYKLALRFYKGELELVVFALPRKTLRFSLGNSHMCLLQFVHP